MIEVSETLPYGMFLTLYIWHVNFLLLCPQILTIP